jgi:hypothetical protein
MVKANNLSRDVSREGEEFKKRMSVYRVVLLMAVAAIAVSLRTTNSSPSRFLPPLAGFAASRVETASLNVVGLGPTLESVKKAHINTTLLPGTLDSYRKDSCVSLGANLLAGRIQKDCIKGSLGILMPSSAYLMVAVGKVRIIELVNPEGGWRITAMPDKSQISVSQTATKLAEPNSSALKEQITHSLISFLRLLSSASPDDLAKLKVASTPSHVVVTWTDGASSNQYYFNRTGLLCDKQVRKNAEGVAVSRYSEYKNVNGAMLPYRIELEGPDGKVISTEVIETWTLSASWPANFFTQDGVVKAP